MIRTPAEIIVAIERSCLAADTAIADLHWEACEACWVEQRRLAHELEIALRGVPRETPDFAPIGRRIDRIIGYRNKQIGRLRAVSAAISERLGTIERFRAFSKSIDRERPAALLDLTT